MMEKLFTAFGTVNHITVRFAPDTREAAKAALDECESLLNDMDDRLSVFKQDSEISQINRSAGLVFTPVSANTFALLRRAKELGAQTHGAFDITTKPLTDAAGGLPSGRVNYRDLLLDKKHSAVKLRRKGQSLHLGGIAKGYAVDLVSDILTSHGITEAIINLGGTVRFLGPPRTTGIRDPFAPERIAASFETAGEAIVTSGLYERGSHIYDPFTGKPAQTDLVSATAVGTDGAAADAAATACIVLGARRSAALLTSMGLEGLLIGADGTMFATAGLQHRLLGIR